MKVDILTYCCYSVKVLLYSFFHEGGALREVVKDVCVKFVFTSLYCFVHPRQKEAEGRGRGEASVTTTTNSDKRHFFLYSCLLPLSCCVANKNSAERVIKLSLPLKLSPSL